MSHHAIHGGSFVAYVCKEGSGYENKPTVETAIANERAEGLETLEVYTDFAKRVADNGQELLVKLKEIKAEGKTVFGLGAPLKGSTLLNYLDIGPDLVECLTEVNEFKIGLLSPGTHIPVVDERTLEKEPDYYLVLAWNFLDFFLEKKKDFLARGGKFLVPIPDVRVIGQDNTPS